MMWRKRKEEALQTTINLCTAIQNILHNNIIERIGGGITMLKRGVIITFGHLGVYIKVLYVSCLLLEVEASWSWTPQLTQHKYCTSDIVYC